MPDDPLPSERTDLLALLARAGSGERDAFDEIFPLVYDELRDIAGRQMNRERAGHTLDATALVHEAYLKMADRPAGKPGNRSHFLAIAARAMRQVLIDHARRRDAAKRGGEWHVTTISGKDLPSGLELDELLALDSALDRLEERQRRVVEYRFFGGMEEREIAEVLGVSTRTVQREWLKARAWIYQELYPERG